MRRYSAEETADKLDMSVEGLNKYERDKLFLPLRTPTGRRYYTEDMIQDLLRGVYDPDKQEKYTIIQEEPVRISINLNKLVKINSISLENVSYFKIPPSKDYNSKYDILEVKQDKTKAKVTYTLGMILEQENEKFFDSIITWESDTL